MKKFKNSRLSTDSRKLQTLALIILKAGIQDKAYILVNIYAPNKDKVSGKLYKNLHRVLQTKDLDCEENIIIGVDFKCPLDPKLDKKGGVNIGS